MVTLLRFEVAYKLFFKKIDHLKGTSSSFTGYSVTQNHKSLNGSQVMTTVALISQ
ncbi:hypothetical protein XBFFR1_1840092 [Xenorhabdus bovienii str. feltiae France]|nr:hypothetical protein XBFFR1_1840092 [Xenorhabdus bovienii str. feltiae France]